jgi:hypothetical protein
MEAELGDLLADFIRRDDRTLYRIAKDAGLSLSIVSEFMAGKRGLSMHSMQELCVTLGIELAPSDQQERKDSDEGSSLGSDTGRPTEPGDTGAG